MRNDDWRIKPNFTLSYGLRYEMQTNIRDYGDWSPRLGIAWGIGWPRRTSRPRPYCAPASESSTIGSPTPNTLNAIRYNGVTQLSYLIADPNFFPTIPSLSSLASTLQPQTIQLLAGDLKAPRTYQANIGVDRQINKYVRLSANYINSRGVHLLRQTDANAPFRAPRFIRTAIDTVRILTESVGFSRTSQFFINPSVNYKKLFMFGFYTLSYGEDDNEGLPANPYNLRAEWGPSSFGDVRQPRGAWHRHSAAVEDHDHAFLQREQRNAVQHHHWTARSGW